MMKTKDMFLVLIRLFLGYIFFSAGVCKLTGGNFGQLIGPPWLEQSLAKYGLGLFAQVVAVSQVVCGLLLLSQRFALLGAIMLVPMNVAILAVTVSMKWVGTPYVNTVFLCLNLVLLSMEHRKFRFLVKPLQPFTYSPVPIDALGQNRFSWLGLAFGVLTMAAAFSSLTLTNVSALLTFGFCAATILASVKITRLEQLLVIIPFLAMVGITFAKLHKQIMPAVIAVLLLTEALLLAYRIYLGYRGPKTQNLSPAATA